MWVTLSPSLKASRLTFTFELSSKRDVKYIALSHYWGNTISKSTTTTLDTLDAHLQEISVQSLTSNFKDVCLVAGSLGVAYVWNDSRCIIQDSVEDWTRESRQMGNIFSQSYCTVGAALAPHVSKNSTEHDGQIGAGFLTSRSSKAVAMVTLLEHQQEEPQQSCIPSISDPLEDVAEGKQHGWKQKENRSVQQKVSKSHLLFSDIRK
jgi:hypothetical protein